MPVSGFGIEQYVTRVVRLSASLMASAEGICRIDFTRSLAITLTMTFAGRFVYRELQITLDRLNELFDLLNGQLQFSPIVRIRAFSRRSDRLGAFTEAFRPAYP